ncbi:MAG: hypothetical protein LBI12_03970 [Treponema sp.]|jgi:hypothetical protein|nr:hypothetical protein [Treponema sp.]
MARTKKSVIENATEPDPQPKVSKYKTAEAEERAIIRRHRAYCLRYYQETKNMTSQERFEYNKKSYEEALAKLGITEPDRKSYGEVMDYGQN